MKRKRHTPKLIIAKLRDANDMSAAGTTIAQICQKPEVNGRALHRWRNQYGGMKASEAKRLKELETGTRPVQEPGCKTGIEH